MPSSNPQNQSESIIPNIVRRHQTEILTEWIQEQQTSPSRQQTLVEPEEIQRQSSEFIQRLLDGLQSDGFSSPHNPGWEPMREFLGNLSRTGTFRGLTPIDTATFILSFKKPLFARLRSELSNDADALARENWLATELLDAFGLFTTEIHQKTREAVIVRQQQELLELSTPVVKLWDGILALPLIGTLDSARTQVVMESLLERIVQTASRIAIIDITGVPTVDTLVAQHLIKTVTAARLMGAECIISGIRPQIAQTIVHLGVELGDITTKSNLSDAFLVAISRLGLMVSAAPSNPARIN